MAVGIQVNFYPRIYCPGCEQVVTYQIDPLPATAESSNNVQDVICPECFYIIATFHE